MVEWSGKEMGCPYEDDALKFVHKISTEILDASSVSKMPVSLQNLKDNHSKSAQPYVRRKICTFWSILVTLH
jgi:hypothetical protein